MRKRIVLTILGMCFLLICYASYVRVVESVSPFPIPDTTPEIPEQEPIWQENEYARTLAIQHFGADSWQATANIALHSKANGLVIYIADYTQTSEKALLIEPFGLIDLDEKPDGGTEVVTLQSDKALVTFNKSIHIFQSTGAQPVAGHLEGNVQITSNRATEQPEDDVGFYTSELSFSEDESKIWTESNVRVVQANSTINGKGLELLLTKVRSKKTKSSDFKVSKAIIRSDVRMSMVAQSGSNLLGAPKRRNARSSKTESPMSIRCSGPFVYDIKRQRVRFEGDVVVDQKHPSGSVDSLFCDDLLVLLNHELSQKGERKPLGSDIKELHASGTRVRVVSQEKQIETVGTKLSHIVSSGDTLLKGTPTVTVDLKGSKVEAETIRIRESGNDETEIIIPGPGSFEFTDSSIDGETLTAQWTESATVRPEDRLQVVRLKGDVVTNLPLKGKLNADQLTMWLIQRQTGGEENETEFEITRLIGKGQCHLESERMLVWSDQLQVDVAAHPAAPPAQDRKLKPVVFRQQKGERTSGNGVQLGIEPLVLPDQSDRTNAMGQLGQRPSELRAGHVKVLALRRGQEFEVSELWTRENVKLKFYQEASPVPVDVSGDSLHLTRRGEPSRLRIEGGTDDDGSRKLATVASEQLTIRGEIIGLDQELNVAWVEGRGDLKMPVDTDLEGNPLEAPIPLTISWQSEMFFDGHVAAFSEKVMAEQLNNTLNCELLEATLASKYDLSKGGSAKQKTSIAKLDCSEHVILQTEREDSSGRPLSENVLVNHLTFDNNSGEILGTGPGEVRIYGYESGGTSASEPPAAGSADESLKLTRILFRDKMLGNKKTQRVTFLGGSQIIHGPVKDTTVVLDADRQIAGKNVWLSCETLDVETRAAADGGVYREMIGTGRVEVETARDFGRADRVTFSESHDRVIFEATQQGSVATMWLNWRGGGDRSMAQGLKFFYYLTSRDIRMEKGLEFGYQSAGRPTEKPQKNNGPTKVR